eukprot:176142_1
MSTTQRKRSKKGGTNKKKTPKNMHRKSKKSSKSSSRSRKRKQNNEIDWQKNLSYGVAVILLCSIGFLFYYSRGNQHHTISVKLEKIEDTHRELPSTLRLKYDHSFAVHNKHLRESETAATAPIPLLFRANVLKTWKHDATDFTQGLELFDTDSDGALILLESTGLFKQSKLKYIKLNDDTTVAKSAALPNNYFGEGCTLYFDEETQTLLIYQLTWKNRKALVYDLDLNVIRELMLPPEMKEGWGIYYDYKSGDFVATDGSPNIYFIEAKTFTVTRSVTVRYMNNDRDATDHKLIKLKNLNEIEMVNGWILANVWYNTNIYVISPYNGFVYGIIECWYMFPPQVMNINHAVLNGIAFDSENNQLIITGKNWPNIFAIQVPAFMMDKSLEDDTN